MKKIWIFGGLVVAVLMVGLVIFQVLAKKQESKAAAPKPTESPKAEQSGDIEAFGTVKANNYKDIYLDFPARIVKLHVTEGQGVAFGQTLVTLDLVDFEAQIKSKSLELNNARYELAQAEKNEQEAAEVYARAKQDLVAQEISNKRDKITLLTSELNRMQSKLNQSYMKGNIIQSDLKHGVVYELGYTAGDPVSVEKKVLTIASLDNMVVDADVPEEFIKDVRIGAKVTILPAADNDRKYEGRVIKIANIALTQNGETVIPVEISIVNSDGFLRPNFNVDVTIEK